MTALAEHVLDTALHAAQRSPWGRLCPPMLACLDELPSTAPLPTLRTRMANERALGLSFIWAAQTRAQLDAIFGQQEARAVLGLTNNLILFGGSKDVAFNQEISDMVGKVRITRTNWNTGQRAGRSVSGEDIPVLTGSEVRQLKERHALVIAENGKPIIARLTRCIDGRAGKRLLADQDTLREQTRRPARADHHQRSTDHRGPRRSSTAQPRPRRPTSEHRTHTTPGSRGEPAIGAAGPAVPATRARDCATPTENSTSQSTAKTATAWPSATSTPCPDPGTQPP